MTAFFSALLLTAFLAQHPAYNESIAGYKIRAKVVGIEDSTCYLGNYYGQHQYIKDTAKANAKGEIIFQGAEPLPGGIYFIVLPGKKYFEFIINREQELYLETDTSGLVEKMKVKGSAENTLFYEYMNYLKKMQDQYQPLKQKMELFKDNPDSLAAIRQRMENIDEAVKNYKINFIQKYPDTFVARIFISSRDPELPEIPVLPNGRKDSTFAYRYFRTHYWDNIDFSDDKILRTPIFYNKINQYFSQIVIQHPDSIIAEADKIIEKSRANKEMFKYVVWYLTYTYETSNVMGFDAIFVHLVEKYYMTNEAWWMSAKTLENITKRAMKLKPILLGKQAPNMIMQDTSLQLQSLYAINAAYTVILFWDYECGHCKTEMPKIREFYNSKKADWNVEIFGVCTDTNMRKMKEYIRENHLNWINVNGPRTLTGSYAEQYDIYSTPVIYLLDEKKIILAKRINIEQVEDYIRRERERKKK